MEENGPDASTGDAKIKYRGIKAMPFIIGNETFENLGSTATSTNLLVYLTSVFNMKSITAITLINIFFGTTNIATLLGAFLCDTYFGRYKTLGFATIASFMGMFVIMLTAAISKLHPPLCGTEQSGACPGPTAWQLAFLISGLGLLVIGAGGIRPCNIAFGADQFDPKTESGKRGISSFFNWYYFTATIAMIISLTVIVYVQSEVSWALGLAIPAFLMFLACVLFFLGSRIYVKVKPEGSLLKSLVQVIGAAVRKRQLKSPEQPWLSLFNHVPTNSINSKLPHSNQFRFLEKGAIITPTDQLNLDGSAANPWRLCSMQKVEELKCLIRVIPIWASAILYYIALSQQQTYVVFQALQSDRRLGNSGFKIPAASYTLFSMLGLGIWLPFYDRIIVPWLQKLTKKEGGITVLQRMGIGMLLVILTMLVSALVEQQRRTIALTSPPAGIDSRGRVISSMSGLWLIPQLTLVGVSEAFTVIAQVEFFYKEFPENMRSISMSLSFVGVAGSSYLNSVLLSVVHRTTTRAATGNWLPEDLNKGRLDYFYYLVAALGVINLVYFLVCGKWYKYKGAGGSYLELEGTMEEMQSLHSRSAEREFGEEIMEKDEKAVAATDDEPEIKHRGIKAMPYIIGNETFEKLGAIGTLSNLLIYLTTVFNMKSIAATTLINVFNGTTNFATLLGAFLSDTYFGRYNTLGFCTVASFMGLLVIALTAAISKLHPPHCATEAGTCIGPTAWQMTVLLTGFGLLIIGAAGIRPCNMAFGVDQFNPNTESGKRGINSFFNWYFFTLTFAQIVSLTLIVYVQSDVSWGIGLGIPAALMFISGILFFSGSRIYVKVKATGSPMTSVVQVIVVAVKKRHLKQPEQPWHTLFNHTPSKSINSTLTHTNQFRFLDRAAIVTPEDRTNPDGSASNPWRLCSMQQVEEVKCLMRVIPIWASAIIYHVPIVQQHTFVVFQALQSNRLFGTTNFKIPASSYSIFLMLGLTLWLPIYDRIVVPSFQRITKKEGGITILQRMGIGIFLSVLTMLLSAIVEERRRNLALTKPTLGIEPRRGAISSLSALWLIPQLAVAGLAEAFMAVGQVEFYYKQFPENMRSIAGSLFFAGMAMSSYLSSFLVSIIHHTTINAKTGNWLPEDLNKGRLDYFYYLIAALGVMNLGYFLVCAKWYKYKGTGTNFPEVDMETKQPEKTHV